MGEALLGLLVIGVVGVATLTDLRRRRIPNWLTLPAALVGLTLNGLLFGIDGLLTSAGGWALGCALLVPLFLLRALGAGDVKLLAALGALRGPEFVFFTCIWTAVAAGPLAVYGLLRSGTLTVALGHIYYRRFCPRAGENLISAGRVPYAPAMAVGALLVLGGVRWLAG